MKEAVLSKSERLHFRLYRAGGGMEGGSVDILDVILTVYFHHFVAGFFVCLTNLSQCLYWFIPDNLQLGEGAFSVVIEATKKDTNESYAVKVVTKSKLTKEDEIALKDEIQVLKELKHDHIIRLYDVFEESSYWYLITEQMKGGELFDRWVLG